LRKLRIHVESAACLKASVGCYRVVGDRIYYQFVLAPKRFKAPTSENGYDKLLTAFFDSFEFIR
jgi:hypothetical protein